MIAICEYGDQVKRDVRLIGCIATSVEIVELSILDSVAVEYRLEDRKSYLEKKGASTVVETCVQSLVKALLVTKFSSRDKPLENAFSNSFVQKFCSVFGISSLNVLKTPLKSTNPDISSFLNHDNSRCINMPASLTSASSILLPNLPTITEILSLLPLIPPATPTNYRANAYKKTEIHILQSSSSLLIGVLSVSNSSGRIILTDASDTPLILLFTTTRPITPEETRGGRIALLRDFDLVREVWWDEVTGRVIREVVYARVRCFKTIGIGRVDKLADGRGIVVRVWGFWFMG
jgi:hypothetical protein